MDGPTFIAYVEQVLTPTLQKGDIVFMDNLRTHKVDGVRQAIEAVGARVRYLPAYSPDLNPIEQAFSRSEAEPRKRMWLGHESVETTQTYLHAHLALKEAALAKLKPYERGKRTRFQPTTVCSPSLSSAVGINLQTQCRRSPGLDRRRPH